MNGRKRARWTAPEIARLKRAWASASRAELEAALPNHSWSSIRSTACDLGLRRAGYGNVRWRAIAARHVPSFHFGQLKPAVPS